MEDEHIYKLPPGDCDENEEKTEDNWMTKLKGKVVEIFACIRLYSLIIITNDWFDRLMLLMILLSSAFMAMADYR